MIARYTRPEMGRIWTDENKFRQWLEVELAASEALAEMGVVPAEAARALREHAGFDTARILEIEKEVKHDVIAFTTAVAESLRAAGHAEESRWLHYGLTSNDVVDTAQALQIRQACGILWQGWSGCKPCCSAGPWNSKHTVQIGRTHGVHAEPITFGLKLAIWYDEAGRNLARLGAAAEDLRVGKISGAVGTFAHIGPEAEERICARLDLKPAPVASQVIQRDRHAALRRRAGAGHGSVREDRARSTAPATHRSSRGGRVLRARAKGQFGDAAQAQPGDLRADLRAGAGGAGQRPGRFRGCGVVA